MADVQNSLPPGWDCKLDPRTNKYYYINHYTRMTTWDDPRSRYRQIHGTPSNVPSIPGEYIPLQHGSPDLGRRNYVYPSQTCPQPAFQMPTHYSPKSIPIQEMNSVVKMSPLTSRFSQAVTLATNRGSPSFSRIQETSITTSAADTEQSVAKISTMFPTVSETHIRILLKKYYNREAVVISALQVEKHPITTPGPYTTPPPSTRNIQTTGNYGPLQMTPPTGIRNCSRTGSPVPRPGSGGSSGSPHITDYRHSPKPHSSPKMKLRYMKSLFPKAEETIILDVLGNNDNNVQKASESLKEMGYEKVDSKASKISKTKPEQPKKSEPPKSRESTPPRMKTLQEKNTIKSTLQNKYQDVPERVVIIALESVDYDEQKAVQILDIMVKEEEDSNSPKNSKEGSPTKRTESNIGESSTSKTLLVSKTPILPSPSDSVIQGDKLDLGKARRTKEKISSFRNAEEKVASQEIGYSSPYLTVTTGPNPTLVKGSNDGMLLEDYMTWDGPDPTLRQGQRRLAKGPNYTLLSKHLYEPHGHNNNLCRGPAFGLAKGSIYSQLKSAVVGESRGK